MKKVIAVLGNDLHLSTNNISLVKDIFQQGVDLCNKYNCSRFLIGGDIFTSRSSQTLEVLMAFKDMIDMCSPNIQLITIPGNHDKTDVDDEKSYLSVFDTTTNFLNKETFVYFSEGSVVICMIPYFKNEKWLEMQDKAICEINSRPTLHKKTKILITHMAFSGVKNNDGTTVLEGILPSDVEFWDKTLVGHYHNASKVGKNIIYTGSVYQNNFGEDLKKGFTLIYDNGDTEFVQSKFPAYIKEVINTSDIQSMEALINKYKDNKTDHIRFVIEGKKEDCLNVNVSALGKMGIDVKFDIQETNEAIDLAESDDLLQYDVAAITNDFESFCKEREITGSKLNYGKNLIKRML